MLDFNLHNDNEITLLFYCFYEFTVYFNTISNILCAISTCY